MSECESVLAKYAEAIGVPFNTLLTYRRVAVAWPANSRLLAVAWRVHQRLAGEPDRATSREDSHRP